MLRTYAAIVFFVTLASKFKMLNLYWFALMWDKTIYKLEIWRLITQFFFIGKFSFGWLIRMMWIITYGFPLEGQVYQFEPADFAFMVIIICSTLSAFAVLYNTYFHGTCFILSLVYVWSRNFPDQQVSLFGLVKIQSFYLPFAFFAISLIMGDDIFDDVKGIAAGHIYYFLWDLYPRAGGQVLLRTPAWLKNMLSDNFGIGRNTYGIQPTAAGRAPGDAGPAGGAANSGFRAFGGSGRRLGSG